MRHHRHRDADLRGGDGTAGLPSRLQDHDGQGRCLVLCAQDLHAATLKNFASKFGWVEDSADVMRVIG
jgi:hypothetical protein